jgi:O-antigen/teichoic acid export membrane protein
MSKNQQHEPQRSSFRQGIFFTSTGTVVNIAFLFLEMMIVVRWLNAESYGIYILLLAIVNFLVIAVDFGFKTAIAQLIASSDGDRVRQSALANSALFFRLAVIAVLSLLIWLAQHLLFLFWNEPLPLLQYAYYLPLMLLVASADELLGGMLRGFQAYRHMVIAQVVRSLLRLALSALLLIVFELGIFGLIYSWMLSFGIAAVYQYLALPITRAWRYQSSLSRELLRFGFPLQLSSFLWFAFGSFRVFLLGLLAGPVSVAYYAVASKIPETLHRLSDSFIAVYFPTMAALLGKGQRGQASWMFSESLRLTSFAVALVALAVVAFSQEIVILIFSAEYEAASSALALLMLAFHMLFLVNLMGYTLTAAGYPGYSLVENVVRTGLTVLGCLLLIPGYGFMGVVYVVFVASYIANPVAVLLLRHIGITVAVAPYAKQTILLLLCAAFSWWVQPLGFTYKVAVIMIYILLNLMLVTISANDLRLILPKALTKHMAARSLTKE